MFQGDGRTVDFDLMDRVAQVAQLGATTTFKYAPDGARFQEKVTLSSDPKFGPRTVYSIDKDYELVVWDGSRDTQERSYLGDSVVVTRNATTRSVTYLHKDRLGSIGFLTTHDPAASEREGQDFDPWGKPRARDWTSSGDRLNADDRLAMTDRGFTGHENLDAHYLIHMNGRVYDYRLGRFLSVDPIISNPANSQSINPYSYIGNNPLSGTDPTGYEAYSLQDHDCRYAQCQVIAVNTRPEQHGQEQGAQRTSGATPQSSTTTCSNPSTCGGQQEVAQKNNDAPSKGGPGEVARQGPKLLSWDFAAGLVFGGYQQAMPGGFLLGSPAADNPSFELGRSFSLGAGSIVQGFEAGKLIAGGLTLAGAGAVTGPGEAVAAPAGGALVLSGVAVGVQAVGNGVEAVRAFSNAMEMRGSGSGGGGKADSPMFGERGTQVTSKTVWKGDGARIDVENPNPGQRPGQIHVQVGKEKYLYDPSANSFRNAPKSVNSLLERQDVQIGIGKAMRILGEGR